MGNALVRQWMILSLIPRPPRRIDAATLEARLVARGIAIHRRTIQRDLVELASVLPIVADERSKPYGWCWSADAACDSIPLHQGAGTIELRSRCSTESARALLARLRLVRPTVRALPDEEATVEVKGWVEDSPRARDALFTIAEEVTILEPAGWRSAFAERARKIAARQS